MSWGSSAEGRGCTIARMDRTALASTIDHTALRPETTEADADRLVAEALREGFAAVCVNGRLLPRVAQALEAATSEKARPQACAVAGFPLGCAGPTALAMEATLLAKAGATEIDVVAWLPALIPVASAPTGDARAEERAALALRDDLLSMVRAVRAVRPSTVVKVILETAALRFAADAAHADRAVADARFEATIASACRGARESGCDFVKTSTGFHPAGGATTDAVRLLRKHAGPMRVKASGGIRSREDALRMLDAGADRIGTSGGVTIVAGGAGAAAY